MLLCQRAAFFRVTNILDEDDHKTKQNNLGCAPTTAQHNADHVSASDKYLRYDVHQRPSDIHIEPFLAIILHSTHCTLSKLFDSTANWHMYKHGAPRY